MAVCGTGTRGRGAEESCAKALHITADGDVVGSVFDEAPNHAAFLLSIVGDFEGVRSGPH